MIVTHALTKRFGRVVAVDGVDLEVREGDRYGFLGPNGSGKTTAVRMLLGLVLATSGEIELLGHPVPRRAGRALREVGALVEGPAAYDHLSARTNLALSDAAGPPGPESSRRPTGRALVQVSDPAAAVSLLDGHVVDRNGDRLVVTGMAVEELTRVLVSDGIGVREAVVERHTLEDAVLRLTGPGSDRVDPVDPVDPVDGSS